MDKAVSVSYGVDLTDSGRTTRKSVLVGPDGKIIKTYETVKPAEHPDEVLADLADLLGRPAKSAELRER